MNHFTLLDKTTTLVGKRCSGKSNLLKYLVSLEAKAFDKMFCICPTEPINRFYKDIVKPNCIYESYNEEWVEKLIDKMTKENSNKTPEKRKRVLLILDDCVSDHNFHQSPSLKKLYTRGRHINISIIITTQYLNSIPPVCRNNSDVIMVGQMNRASIQLLLDEFMSGNILKEDFIKLYHRATTFYGFLVINNNSVKKNDLNLIYGIVKCPLEKVV